MGRDSVSMQELMRSGSTDETKVRKLSFHPPIHKVVEVFEVKVGRRM